MNKVCVGTAGRAVTQGVLPVLPGDLRWVGSSSSGAPTWASALSVTLARCHAWCVPECDGRGRPKASYGECLLRWLGRRCPRLHVAQVKQERTEGSQASHLGFSLPALPAEATAAPALC